MRKCAMQYYLSLSQKIKKMLVAQIRKKKQKERAVFFTWCENLNLMNCLVLSSAKSATQHDKIRSARFATCLV